MVTGSDKGLELAKGLVLHGDAVVQKINVLGQSGGGKTYLAMKIAELMLQAKKRICVLDLVGVWSGLLSSADGLHPGFPLLVIGGEQGHLPLNPRAGDRIADLVVDEDVSTIVDLSDLLAEDPDAMATFAADFLAQLFRRHKALKPKRRRHLFYEEAQELFPEQVPSSALQKLRLVGLRVGKIGRNHGLGYTTITQEPQSVSKRMLNQAGTLIAVRTIGELERKAIAGTARSSATAELDLVNVLPELQTGEAIVWSPAWLKFAGRVRILRKVTFDSSKTPDDGDEVTEPKVLAQVDLGRYREALSAVVAEAEANDPEALRAQVKRLESELAARAPPAPPERIEVPVPTQRGLDALIEVEHQLLECTRTLRELQATRGFSSLKEPEPGHTPDNPAPWTQGQPMPLRVRYVTPVAAAAPTSSAAGPLLAGLKKGAREMLAELVAFYPKALTQRELATRVVMSHSGGSFGRYLSALRSAGYIEDDENGDPRATESGCKAMGAVAPKTADVVVEGWKRKLKRGARLMLDATMEAHRQRQEPVSEEALGLAGGGTVSGGSFGRYLSALRASGCLERSGKGKSYIAGPALFLGERR